VIDDDEESYTVQRIIKMKNAHEALPTQMSEDDASKGATLLLSVNQSGGIIAHSIHAHTINVQAPLARVGQDAAFESILARARKIHEDRTAIIAAGTGSVPVLDGGVIVMHVVPFSAVDTRSTPSFDEISRNPKMFLPIGSVHLDFRISFDGLLTGSNGDGLGKPQRAYVQVFRSGAIEAIEAIEASLARGRQGNCLILPLIQATIIQYSRIYAASLQACGIDPPIAVLVSLVQAKGMRLLRDTIDRMVMLPADTPFGPINDDLLHFGEAIFDTVPTDNNESAKLLNPILGHFANAAGLASSPYFDADGNYAGRFKV
jgi:hypothetical protein